MVIEQRVSSVVESSSHAAQQPQTLLSETITVVTSTDALSEKEPSFLKSDPHVERPELINVQQAEVIFSAPQIIFPDRGRGRTTSEAMQSRIQAIEEAYQGESIQSVIGKYYYDLKLPLKQIAGILQVSQTTLQRWMDTFGMQKNRIPVSVLNKREETVARTGSRIPTRTELEEARKNHPSMSAAAASLGIGEVRYRRYLTIHGIPPHTRSESLQARYKDEEKKQSMLEKVHSDIAREKRRQSIRDAHREGRIRKRPETVKKYEEAKLWQQEIVVQQFRQGMSDSEMATFFGVHSNTIAKWRLELGLERSQVVMPSPNEERRALIEAFRKTPYYQMLTSRQQAYCDRRFPRNDEQPASLSEFGTSRQAAHQMEVNIANKIKNICHERGISLIDLLKDQ